MTELRRGNKTIIVFFVTRYLQQIQMGPKPAFTNARQNRAPISQMLCQQKFYAGDSGEEEFTDNFIREVK